MYQGGDGSLQDLWCVSITQESTINTSMKNTCIICGEKCKNKFCSISCRNVYWNPIVKQYKNSSSKKSEKIQISRKCLKCGKDFILFVGSKMNLNSKKLRTHCSRICANSHVRTEESKKKLSKKLTNKIFDKISKQWIDKKIKICPICNKTFNSKRKYCSNKCMTKNSRKNTPLIRAYRCDCKFNFNPYRYPKLFDLELLKIYGFYSPSNKNNNIEGVSMDHKLSIVEGFSNNVDPYYMSHLMNCQLLKHSDNIRKHSKSSLTVSELKLLVDDYDKKVLDCLL